jgi:hypothetical protein
MELELLVGRVLEDEGLVGDLEGDEAAKLVAWTVQRVERLAAAARDPDTAAEQVEQLCRTARAIARTVTSWCQQETSAAEARARAAGLPWPIEAPPEPAATLDWILARVPV